MTVTRGRAKKVGKKKRGKNSGWKQREKARAQ